MTLSFEQLEPTSPPPRLDAALGLRHRLDAEIDPDYPPVPSAEFRGALTPNETFDRIMTLALDDDRPVGISRLWLNKLGSNTHRCEVEIEVDPDHRRRGIGTRLLEDALDRAEADGRTFIAGGGVNSVEQRGFWGAVGATVGIDERLSRLWLADTDSDLMTRWIEQRLERAQDYDLVFWRGRCPEEHLDRFVALMTAMNDAPLDDLEWDPDTWTRADLRRLEEHFENRGLERWMLMAVDPAGEPAGMTEALIHTYGPKVSDQGNTVVIAAHRGRGIGRWLKAEMWQRLRRDAPEVEALDTENAESNDPMLAINVAMGFRPHLDIRCFQAEIADIRSAMGQR